MKIVLTLVSISFILFAGCANFAVMIAPEKKEIRSKTEAAKNANNYFFDALHNGRYEDIPKVLVALQASYLENPNDSELAAHIGFAHIWRLAERYRMGKIDPDITDSAILCKYFFSEAYRLGSDARHLGFYGSCAAAQAQIFHDEKLRREAYFVLKDAVSAWPEFNEFTMGYVMSGLPYDSDLFQEAVNRQWRTIKLCVGKIDQSNPDVSGLMHLETKTGVKRACWNSWIAPHNFEGFFLNMGDMLVKKGNWQTAKKIYANAKLSESYGTWKFKGILEERIKNAQANVEHFRKPLIGNEAPAHPIIMFNSKFSCVACHQN